MMQTSTKILTAFFGFVAAVVLIGVGIIIGYYAMQQSIDISTVSPVNVTESSTSATLPTNGTFATGTTSSSTSTAWTVATGGNSTWNTTATTISDPSDTTVTSTSPSRMSDEEVRRRLFDNINNENIRENLRKLTVKSHPSGTEANWEVGEYIYNAYIAAGLEGVHYANYEVLLSRPNETTPNSVQILNADGTQQLSLKYREDTSGDFENAFFGYAPAASVMSSSLVYANLARDQDFAHLKTRNISVNGSIVLARYGGFRGDQVKTAAKYGAIAVLLFLDPSAVAPYGVNVSDVYPNSQWMPGSAMERGSVYLGKGDPQSQGFVSGPNGNLTYRAKPDPDDMPKIPATPIGYEDANRLFQIMRSSTTQNVPRLWIRSPDMSYTYGGLLTNNRTITMTTTNYEVSKPIRNIIGRIQGCEEPDRYVILGNHYDPWTMGAIDPNSGTAVILELARVAGELRKSGWCPRRTVVFGSWDAEEYGLIGSTEWVEENLQILHERAVAYVNVDAAVRGRISFRALSMPLLDDLIYESTRLVRDPHILPEGNISLSVYDIWANNSANAASNFLPAMGNVAAGSDYANFVNMVGITSVDIRYVGEKSNPAYHTGFETFDYVERHIDPDFKYHVAVGQVWIEMVRSLAESVILPFSVMDLARDMKNSWASLKSSINEDNQYPFALEINLDALSDAILMFGNYSQNLNALLVQLKQNNESFTQNQTLIREVNNRLMKLERMFVDPSGLPNRPLIRHILQAPAKTNAYGSASFAGIADCVSFAKEAIDNGNLAERDHWIDELKLHYTKVVQMISRAARFLAISVNGSTDYSESLSG